ncbi:hypothetical protein R3P38DRAFT_3299884 [Favolaschia claudopus]|uniref:Chromo domain-containing protein n=1 Tax=Favolaschia claudopus TaxID=2862362 RepID=A0AAV9YZ58_9AGAR
MSDEKEDFEIEGIIDSRVENKELEYLVRWKGHGSGDDSWVAAKDMNASEEIREYERKSAQNKRQRPTTPRPAKPVKLSRRSGRNRFDGSDNAESTDTNACVPAEPPLTIEPVPMQAFLPHLLRRWMEPPLCHYLVARESVLSALTLLSQFPSALLSRSTFPVPPCAEFPTSSLIMEDLLSREYSCYHDLGSDQRSEAKVAVVVVMLSESYLTQSSFLARGGVDGEGRPGVGFRQPVEINSRGGLVDAHESLLSINSNIAAYKVSGTIATNWRGKNSHIRAYVPRGIRNGPLISLEGVALRR